MSKRKSPPTNYIEETKKSKSESSLDDDDIKSTISFQVICNNEIFAENEEIQLDLNNSTVLDLKQSICSSFEGFEVSHIQDVINDLDNTKIIGNKKILSSFLNDEDSITIVLTPQWIEENDEVVEEEDDKGISQTTSKGRGEFEVEKILGHKYVTKTKLTMFLVKWEGYSDEHNTFEPASNLEHCSVFHKYIKGKCRKNPKSKLISLIPKKYL